MAHVTDKKQRPNYNLAPATVQIKRKADGKLFWVPSNHPDTKSSAFSVVRGSKITKEEAKAKRAGKSKKEEG